MEKAKVLRESYIASRSKELILEYPSPVDLHNFNLRHVITWPIFFNYDLDFGRLCEAFKKLVEQYQFLCGRLGEDQNGDLILKVGPSIDGKYYFPVTELTADMKISEAILYHGRISSPSANYPLYPENQPFFTEVLNVDGIIKGVEPFLKVKLTHLEDGCVLSISITHLLVDGRRFAELFRDLGRAYCGHVLPSRCYDRFYFFHEYFSKSLGVSSSKAQKNLLKLPSTKQGISFKKYPNDSCSIEMLHVPQDTLDQLKNQVSSCLPSRSFVSSGDVLHALCWILDCELKSNKEQIQTGRDLNISGTLSCVVMELLLAKTKLIPENYTGNACVWPGISAPDSVNDQSLIEALATLALCTRRKINDVRQNPETLYDELCNNFTPCLKPPENFAVGTSNFTKLPLRDVDFGNGAPTMLLTQNLLPLGNPVCFIAPTFRKDGGVFLSLTLTGSQLKKLRNSQVLHQCAPATKRLYEDYSMDDLEKLLKLKSLS